jgi:lactobin A/cerein 7B family class IIb bacteriocin
MVQQSPVGFAFEELTEAEMMEVDGGVAWASFLTTTTLPCVGGGIIIGAGVGLILTATLCK